VSVNDTITSLRTTQGGNPDGTYTVTRTAEGARVLGRSVPGGSTTFPIIAGIESSGRALQDMAEGQRGDEMITIYTATALLTRRPGFAPDVVTYQPPGYAGAGEPWTVTSVEVIEGFDEVHYEVLACRAPSPAGVVP
jgi:hypothetical protein